MADDTPKTPAPRRRKAAATPRKSARAAPRATKTPPAGETAATATPTTRRKRATGPATPTAPKRASAAKPGNRRGKTATRTAADKVADAASSARRSVAQSAPVQAVADTRDRLGDRNFFAAIVGGAAAIGAAVAGVLYALRDGNPFAKEGGAHQADGTDSSKSFKAGIADEGTIPE